VLLFSVRIDILLREIVCAAAGSDEDSPSVAVVKWLEIGMVGNGRDVVTLLI